MHDHVGQDYWSLPKAREWEFLFNGTLLLILKPAERIGNHRNLIGVREGIVQWSLGGLIGDDARYDAIVSVYVADNHWWAGTWSGYALRFDPHTGAELERKFTK